VVWCAEADLASQEVMMVYWSLLHKCVNTTTGRPYIVSFDASFPNSPKGKDQGMEQGTSHQRKLKSPEAQLET
jgi:hypothetical protein